MVGRGEEKDGIVERDRVLPVQEREVEVPKARPGSDDEDIFAFALIA